MEGTRNRRFPSLSGQRDLAYLHAIEPHVTGGEADNMDSNDFLRKIWGDKAFIATGGYNPQTVMETVNTKGGLIAFGRHYIANVSFLPSHVVHTICGGFNPDWAFYLQPDIAP